MKNFSNIIWLFKHTVNFTFRGSILVSWITSTNQIFPARQRSGKKFLPGLAGCGLLCLGLLSPAMPAEASLFKGEALDKAADVLAWVVLVVAPAIGITVFWLIHILPEKIAEKKNHPQAKAIQTLCLLSLFFRRPPLAARLAVGLHQAGFIQKWPMEPTREITNTREKNTRLPVTTKETQMERLRARLAELEAKQSANSVTEGGTV